MTQSKYTIELRTLLLDENFDLFDFNYNFYHSAAKQEFEILFKDYFYYYEIGSETVERFKHNLKTKLNVIAPYYTQLYETELKSKDINFLLNKDLEETIIRNQKSNNDQKTLSDFSGKSDSNYKESSIDNGVASVSLTANNLTTVNNNVDNVSNTNNVNMTGNNNTNEETKLISKGNIGTTSSGQLLTAWRETILNINKMILDECQELFMGVY